MANPIETIIIEARRDRHPGPKAGVIKETLGTERSGIGSAPGIKQWGV